MLTQSRIVIGGSNPLKVHKVKELFATRFGKKHYIITDSTSAEIIKYMSNNFLALKISFINEYYNLVENIVGDWKNDHWVEKVFIS
jgi:UDPglucose 6-dehydrogenase